jgi:hypothetical protein
MFQCCFFRGSYPNLPFGYTDVASAMQVLANLLVREVITLFSNLIFSISCVIIDWHTLKVFHAYIVTFPQQGAGNHLVYKNQPTCQCRLIFRRDERAGTSCNSLILNIHASQWLYYDHSVRFS